MCIAIYLEKFGHVFSKVGLATTLWSMQNHRPVSQYLKLNLSEYSVLHTR